MAFAIASTVKVVTGVAIIPEYRKYIAKHERETKTGVTKEITKSQVLKAASLWRITASLVRIACTLSLKKLSHALSKGENNFV